MFKKIELFLIRCYQKYPKTNGRCRLTPTCSNYALTALYRFGLIKGNFLILKRLFLCSSKKSNILVDNVPQNIKGDYKWLI